MAMDTDNGERGYEVRHFRLSMVIPALFIFLLWAVYFIQVFFGWDVHYLGIYPLRFNGLQGILSSPLVHGNLAHLWNNSVPLFVLLTAVYYFYPRIGNRVFVFVYLVSGIWVWVFARASWHIGASGIVYGLASFLFVGGILRREVRLLALSLLVVFLYGSMIWGIFPIYDHVSWESHMLGSLAGVIIAVWYRRVPPAFPEKKPFWEEEEEEDDDPPPLNELYSDGEAL